MRNAEQFLRCTDGPLFKGTFQNPLHAVQKPSVTLEAILESDIEVPLSRLTPEPNVQPIQLELRNHLHFLASIRHTVEEKARGIHAFVIENLLIKAVEDALLYAFNFGYEEVRDGLKNSSFYSAETVLTKIAQQDILNNRLEGNLEK